MAGDWKTYLAGGLFTISTALTGVAYSSVTADIQELQSERKQVAADARQAAIQAAVAVVQMEQLQKDVNSLMATTDRLDARQEQIMREVASLTFVISQNTKTYRDAISRWNDELTRKKD